MEFPDGVCIHGVSLNTRCADCYAYSYTQRIVHSITVPNAPAPHPASEPMEQGVHRGLEMRGVRFEQQPAPSQPVELPPLIRKHGAYQTDDVHAFRDAALRTIAALKLDNAQKDARIRELTGGK